MLHISLICFSKLGSCVYLILHSNLHSVCGRLHS